MLIQSETEKLICDKLVEMMENKPFYKIKVTDLVKYAGISRSTFYVYFDSIYSVLQKIEDDYFSGLIDESVRSFESEEKMNSWFMNVADNIFKNAGTLQVLTGPNGDPSLQARMCNRSRKAIPLLFDKIPQVPTHEKKFLSEFMIYGCWGLAKCCVSNKEEICVNDFAEIIHKITNMFLNYYEDHE